MSAQIVMSKQHSKIYARALVIEIISGLLIILFMYTGIMKLRDHFNFTAALNASPLLKNFASLLSYGIPISEIIISVMLFIPKARKFGLYSATVFMIMFTLYVAYMIVFIPNKPCSCGGVLKYLSWPQHLLFNICFTFLAATGILLNRKSTFKRALSKSSIS
ncbi:MAG: MauE/DoxX family redox-associated membrane protein [Pseudobacter sp.]|uniref:MauE/DoxX family redox-associated membrane protein n=1 Tax=Pseudobacter sp. TaxID=2045420 RepID=UPI003F80415B